MNTRIIRLIISGALLCSLSLVAHAQTPPKAPSGLPSNPCEQEMKAMMNSMPAVKPGVTGKGAPPAPPSTAASKAFEECMKKNGPKLPGGQKAPAPGKLPDPTKTPAVKIPPNQTVKNAPPPGVKMPANDKNAKPIDPTKIKAPPARVKPAAIMKNPPKAGVQPGSKGGPCPVITKELKVASRDAEVVVLKTFLASEGLLTGVQNTSYFGPATEKALKEWQKKKGLTESGVTDAKTQAAMKNCAPAAPAKTTTPKKK
jgi:hypothetical protein